jgi:hypothetical protein
MNKESNSAIIKNRETIIINEMVKLKNKQKALKNVNITSNVNGESYIKNLEEESDVCVDKIISEIFDMK